MEIDQLIPALNRLATDLKAIFEKHPICEDTDVRDRICGVLQETLLNGDINTRLPGFFGTFSLLAELRLLRALRNFLSDPSVTAFAKSGSAEARVERIKRAFDADQVVTTDGTPMTWFLGEWV